jgi:hypothetical protein
MATISITIPDTHQQWAIDALCDWGGYEENKQENETKPQFAKRMIALKVKGITLSYIRKIKNAEMDDDVLLIQTGLDIN